MENNRRRECIGSTLMMWSFYAAFSNRKSIDGRYLGITEYDIYRSYLDKYPPIDPLCFIDIRDNIKKQLIAEIRRGYKPRDLGGKMFCLFMRRFPIPYVAQNHNYE